LRSLDTRPAPGKSIQTGLILSTIPSTLPPAAFGADAGGVLKVVAGQLHDRSARIAGQLSRARRALMRWLARARKYSRTALMAPMARGLRFANSVLTRSATQVADRIRQRPDWKAVSYVLAIAAGFLCLSLLLELPHGLEHWSSDLRTAYLSPRPPTQDARIALVYITDATLERFQYVSPTDRQFLADLVKAVDAAGAQLIGLDFIFSGPTEPAKDQALLEAVRGARAEVVLGAIEEPLSPNKPLHVFTECREYPSRLLNPLM
jgi:CHASE2 domain